MRIRDTIPLHGEIKDGCPAPVFRNSETHWWDASQLYGSDKERQSQVRTFVDGKIKVDDNGRLPKSDIPGVDLTGMNENWWVGVGMLHTLFALEHNAVCDALKKAYPQFDDQRLFELDGDVAIAVGEVGRGRKNLEEHTHIRLQLKQVNDGRASCSTPCLWDFICLKPVYASLIGKEQ